MSHQQEYYENEQCCYQAGNNKKEKNPVSETPQPGGGEK